MHNITYRDVTSIVPANDQFAEQLLFFCRHVSKWNCFTDSPQ